MQAPPLVTLQIISGRLHFLAITNGQLVLVVESRVIHEKYFTECVSRVMRQHNGIRFADMPTCQVCITEVAEVTDNGGASTQQIKTLKNISSGILIALFFYRRK